MKNFDMSMEVQFCKKHKKYWENKVKVKCGKSNCIDVQRLMRLLHGSEKCLECQWKTTFGKDKHETGRKHQC